MPIGLLILTAIPTTIGVAEGISEDKRQREAEAAAKAAGLPSYFTLFVSCDSRRLDAETVTIRNGKAFVGGTGHPSAGYFRPFLGTEIQAMVTTTCNDPPAMGWVYVHSETGEVRVGKVAEATEHAFGPWGYDGSVALDGKEGFVAVQEEGGDWGLYYVPEGDREKWLEGKTWEALRVRKSFIADLIPAK